MALTRYRGSYKRTLYGAAARGISAYTRATGESPGQSIKRYFAAKKRHYYPADSGSRKKGKSSEKPQDQANNTTDEVAQQDIGFGSHEARRLYTAKRNKRRTYKAKKFKKRRQAFAKHVHSTLNARYPYQKTIINVHSGNMGATADQQNMYMAAIATSNFGDGGDSVIYRENDLLNIMAQQSLTSSYDARTKQIKKILYDCNWTATLVNRFTEKVFVQVHQMVCKRNMMRLGLEQAAQTTELAAGAPTTIQNWLFEYQPDAEMDAQGNLVTPNYQSYGVRPTDLNLVRKYFKTEKIDRYEVETGGTLYFNRSFLLKKKLTPKNVSDHTCIADVTRIFVFVFSGIPYTDGATHYVAKAIDGTNTGVQVIQSRMYRWKNYDDSYSRLTTGQLAEQFPTISFSAHGNTTLLGTPMSVVTT